MAMKLRTRALFPRRVFIALAFLFVSLVGILYALLKRTYGIIGPPSTLTTPDAASNAARLAHGLPPREYWPLKHRTRLRHMTAISKNVGISEVIAVRNRNLPRSADYRTIAPSKFAIRISLIASCKDRTGFLQSALPTWLDALGSHDEIVLIDWGTSATAHVPHMAVVEAIKDSRINLVTIPNTNSWVLSRAYNLGFAHARGEWVLKVDCDTMLNSNFFDSLQLPSPPISTNPAQSSVDAERVSEASVTSTDAASAINEPQQALPNQQQRHYYRVLTNDAKDENEQFLSGVFLIHSDDLRNVRGFDERITSYGWENVDLYDRLEKREPPFSLVPKPFAPNAVSHILHGEVFRAADRPDSGGPVFEVELNRLVIRALGPWHTRENFTACTYSHRVASNDARYVFAEPERVLPPAIDSLPISTQESVLADARAHVLHEVYGIPLDVLSEVSRSRAELVRELARLRRSGEWLPRTGVIFAEVVGTAASRLLGVASAVAIARQHRRPLFLAWRPSDDSDVRRDARIDGVLDLTAASVKGVHVFQVGTWPCRYSTVDACAAADKAYARAVQFNADTDLATVEETLIKRSEMNVVLRMERAMSGLQRTQIVRSLRSLQPSTTLGIVLRARAEALATRQGIYLGPRLREHTIDAIAKRLNAGLVDGQAPAYFVVGGDRTLVRRARRALGADLSINGAGDTEKLDGLKLEFAELFALARCRAVVNDGRTPQDVFDAVSAVREALADTRT